MNEVIENWRSVEKEDQILKKQLEKKDSLIEQFFKGSLGFTGDRIDAKMGVGTSQFNEITVGRIALAHAKLLKNKGKNPKIVVSHDNNGNSELFAKKTIDVLQNNGVKVYKFADGPSQPMGAVTFAIKKLKADGGVIIGNGYLSKDSNSYRFFDATGGNVSALDQKFIEENIVKSELLDVDMSSIKPSLIENSVLDEYKKLAVGNRLFDFKMDNISAVFAAQQGTSLSMIPELFKTEGCPLFTLKKHQDLTFKNKVIKNTNPLESKSLYPAEWRARREKADLMFTLDSVSEGIGIAVKHKKRYKYLTYDQIAAIYLEYKLLTLKHKNKLKENSFIVVSHFSSEILSKIAYKFGVQTIRVDSSSNELQEVINTHNGNFIFACDHQSRFKVSDRISGYDSVSFAIAFAEAVSYWKSQNIEVYEKLNEIYNSFGIHRTKKIEKNVNKNQNAKLLKKVASLKVLGDKKVMAIVEEQSSNSNKRYIVKFNDNSWVAFDFKDRKKIDIYIENISKRGGNILDIIAFEKEVDAFVGDNLEEFEDKQWSWKAFFKYTVFIGIVAAILVFVFQIVYQTNSTTGKVPIFSVAQSVISGTNRALWLILWLWWFATRLLGGWMKKRMFMRLGEKVKVRHIVISQIMGSVIGFVTPFAIGGDAIGYWYLRRKGVKKAPLIATLSAATIWGEAKFALETIFLVAVGWKLYEQIFNHGDIQAHAALIWFFVGLAWSYFGAFMLMLLTMSRRVQEFIVRNTVKILEWIPFVPFCDPIGKEADVQYEFKLIRTGMRRLYNKWWFVLEMMTYDLIPLLFNPMPLILMSGGVIDPNVPAGPYWAYIVGGDIIGTANSMSLTPGGSGTAEWLDVTIMDHLYSGGSLSGGLHGFDGKTIASGVDFLSKMVFSWPDLAISTGTIFMSILLVRKKPLKIFNGIRKYVFIGASILVALSLILTIIFII